MEILGGLATSGRLLNGRDNRTNNIKRKTKRHPRNENSVYNSSGLQRMTNISNNLAMDRFAKSDNFPRSGIIPQFYNRKLGSGKHRKEIIEEFDSEFTDDENDNRSASSVSVSGDPTYFLNKGGSVMDNRAHERAFVAKAKNEGNNYESQFDSLAWDNSGDPVSQNAVYHSPSNIKRMEAERNLALNGGYSNFDNDPDMTYGVVSKENFVHNNMMPYFKGKGYGSNPMREQQTNLMSQRKMELFSGSQNDPTYRARTESAPLFGPLSGVTNIFGTPVVTDAMKSRYNVSQNRQGELPFRQTKVTPGLGLGYNENNKQGYGVPYRVLPKTVDELRPANRPKISYSGVIVPGMKGQKGPTIGKIVKRRAERFKEYGTDRMVKGLGYIKAPTLYGEFNKEDMATKNRGLLRRIQYGPAKQHIDKATPEEMRGKYKNPTKQSYKEAGPRNIILVEGQQARGESNTYVPKITKRGQDNEYIGPTGTSQISKGVAFDIVTNMHDPTKRAIHAHIDRAGTAMTGAHKGIVFDPTGMPDPTKRDVHNSYDRAGNTMTGAFNKGHMYLPDEMPDPTKRDVHNSYDRAGNTMTGAFNKGHMYLPDEMPDPTKRDIHNKFDRTGTAINGSFNKGHMYSPNEMPDPTKRDIHNKFDRIGTAINGSFNKGHMYLPDEMPDPTKRDVRNKFDRTGTAINGLSTKGHVYDQNEMPDPTKRDIHNKFDRTGTAINGSFNKGHVYNPEEMPDPTKRDVHNKFDRAGTSINGSFNKGHMYNPEEMPDPTKRDVHNSYDRAGSAINGSHIKGHIYNPNEMPDPTKRDVHNRYDRAGLAINGSHNKGHTYNPTEMPDPTKRDIHNKTDRAGTAISGSFAKGRVFDPTDVVDPTKREIHSKLDRTAGGAKRDVSNGYTINYTEAAPDATKRDMHNKLNRSRGGAKNDVSNGYTINYAEATPDQTKREMYSKLDRTGGGAKADVDSGYTINYVNATPDPTKRDIHSKRTYVNPARGNYDGNRSRHDANHMVLNDVRETIAKGRTPVVSNYTKVPTLDSSSVYLCDPIQINRANLARAVETNDKLPFVNTQIPMLKSVENDRMDSHIEINLSKNPYINNMIHKAV